MIKYDKNNNANDQTMIKMQFSDNNYIDSYIFTLSSVTNYTISSRTFLFAFIFTLQVDNMLFQQ